MISRPIDIDDRPYNNLLRRLIAPDYALIAVDVERCILAEDELLYNPGDHVELVAVSRYASPNWPMLRTLCW